GADTVIPVDIYVPGCAARPQAIIDGVVQAVELFQQRSDEHDALVRKGGA
ncbi:MAG: NADH:ubiquinone oxidoreductase, partial [Lachnospiraceae bacterium]|nr:NADH:ubiquinone oxidoreductase [Lachnospiraceae bacterium]